MTLKETMPWILLIVLLAVIAIFLTVNRPIIYEELTIGYCAINSSLGG